MKKVKKITYNQGISEFNQPEDYTEEQELTRLPLTLGANRQALSRRNSIKFDLQT
jgi:hypothetical protein